MKAIVIFFHFSIMDTSEQNIAMRRVKYADTE